MKSLLVCSVLVAATSAQYLGYPYALGSPLTYTYTPHVVKPVVKEVPVEVPYVTYVAKETGCVNSFGTAVPCLQEGEARRKRAADDEEDAAAPAPAVTVKAAEPVVTEVEVPQLVYKPVEQKIELAPACQNAFGIPVPCA